MANRTLYPSQSYGSGRVDMAFELLGGGAAATLTVSTDTGGVVSSITRDNTGIFSVTLKDAFQKVVYKNADPDDTLNDGAYCTVSDIANEGTSSALTFKIRFRAAAGTLADPALSRRIGVTLILRNTKGWGTV